MDLEIVHSALCETNSVSKKCLECRKKYGIERKRRSRQIKKDKIIKTRGVTKMTKFYVIIVEEKNL